MIPSCIIIITIFVILIAVSIITIISIIPTITIIIGSFVFHYFIHYLIMYFIINLITKMNFTNSDIIIINDNNGSHSLTINNLNLVYCRFQFKSRRLWGSGCDWDSIAIVSLTMPLLSNYQSGSLRATRLSKYMQGRWESGSWSIIQTLDLWSMRPRKVSMRLWEITYARYMQISSGLRSCAPRWVCDAKLS